MLGLEIAVDRVGFDPGVFLDPIQEFLVLADRSLVGLVQLVQHAALEAHHLQELHLLGAVKSLLGLFGNP